jgi:hypothetical protein
MVKPCLTLLIFLSSFIGITSGQASTHRASTHKSPQFGLTYSAHVGWRRLENTQGTEYLDYVIRFRDSLETPRLGFNLGLTVLFNIDRPFTIETGMEYSNTRFMRIQTSTNPDLGDGKLFKQTSFFNYHYVEFPLRARLNFGKGKVRLTTAAGISANLFLKDTQCHEYEYQNAPPEEKKGISGFEYRQFNAMPSVSLGILCQLSEHLLLGMEPTVRYGLSQTVKQPITNRLMNVGVRTMLMFQ